MHLMLLAGLACIMMIDRVVIWYTWSNWCSIGTILVAASAAGGAPFCDQQRSLTVGSYLGRQCHYCCEQTCLRVTSPPPKKSKAGACTLKAVVLDCT
jgi:hypothetical protein